MDPAAGETDLSTAQVSPSAKATPSSAQPTVQNAVADRQLPKVPLHTPEPTSVHPGSPSPHNSTVSQTPGTASPKQSAFQSLAKTRDPQALTAGMPHRHPQGDPREAASQLALPSTSHRRHPAAPAAAHASQPPVSQALWVPRGPSGPHEDACAAVALSFTVALAAARQSALPAPLLHLVSPFRSQHDVLQTLGKGGFGQVSLVRSRLDHRLLAVKSVRFWSAVPPWSPPQALEAQHDKLLREVRSLSSLSWSPHVVHYHAAWIEPDWARLGTQLASQARRHPALAQLIQQASDAPAPTASSQAATGCSWLPQLLEVSPRSPPATPHPHSPSNGRHPLLSPQRSLRALPLPFSAAREATTDTQHTADTADTDNKDRRSHGAGSANQHRPQDPFAKMASRSWSEDVSVSDSDSDSVLEDEHSSTVMDVGVGMGGHRGLPPLVANGIGAQRPRFSHAGSGITRGVSCTIVELGHDSGPAPSEQSDTSTPSQSDVTDSDSDSGSDTGVGGGGPRRTLRLSGRAEYSSSEGSTSDTRSSSSSGGTGTGDSSSDSDSDSALSREDDFLALPNIQATSIPSLSRASSSHDSAFTFGGTSTAGTPHSSAPSSTIVSPQQRHGSIRPAQEAGATSHSPELRSRGSQQEQDALALVPAAVRHTAWPAPRAPAALPTGKPWQQRPRHRMDSVRKQGPTQGEQVPDSCAVLSATGITRWPYVLHISMEPVVGQTLDKWLLGRNTHLQRHPAPRTARSPAATIERHPSPRGVSAGQQGVGSTGPAPQVVSEQEVLSVCLGPLEKDIFMQLVQGLVHIHSAGILHRDIKPSNIFVIPHASPAHHSPQDLQSDPHPPTYPPPASGFQAAAHPGVLRAPHSVANPTQRPFPPVNGVSKVLTGSTKVLSSGVLVKIGDFGLSVAARHDSAASRTSSSGTNGSHEHGPWGPAPARRRGVSIHTASSSEESNAATHTAPEAMLRQQSSTGTASLQSYTSGVGTASYAAPEQQSGPGLYDHSVDVYPLGLILLELAVPFQTGMERAMAMQDARRGQLPPALLSLLPAESALIQTLLCQDPTQRPSSQQLLHLLQHMWCTSGMGSPGAGTHVPSPGSSHHSLCSPGSTYSQHLPSSAHHSPLHSPGWPAHHPAHATAAAAAVSGVASSCWAEGAHTLRGSHSGALASPPPRHVTTTIVEVHSTDCSETSQSRDHTLTPVASVTSLHPVISLPSSNEDSEVLRVGALAAAATAGALQCVPHRRGSGADGRCDRGGQESDVQLTAMCCEVTDASTQTDITCVSPHMAFGEERTSERVQTERKGSDRLYEYQGQLLTGDQLLQLLLDRDQRLKQL